MQDDYYESNGFKQWKYSIEKDNKQISYGEHLKKKMRSRCHTLRILCY